MRKQIDGLQRDARHIVADGFDQPIASGGADTRAKSFESHSRMRVGPSNSEDGLPLGLGLCSGAHRGAPDLPVGVADGRKKHSVVRLSADREGCKRLSADQHRVAQLGEFAQPNDGFIGRGTTCGRLAVEGEQTMGRAFEHVCGSVSSRFVRAREEDSFDPSVVRTFPQRQATQRSEDYATDGRIALESDSFLQALSPIAGIAARETLPKRIDRFSPD
jgi:hypothetical protein